jgi:hypothetical protein
LWVAGQSTPDPNFALLMDDGCIANQGKPVNTPSRYNYYGGYNQGLGNPSEFVVKNSERVRIRYIVELMEKTEEEKQKEMK